MLQPNCMLSVLLTSDPVLATTQPGVLRCTGPLNRFRLRRNSKYFDLLFIKAKQKNFYDEQS